MNDDSCGIDDGLKSAGGELIEALRDSGFDLAASRAFPSKDTFAELVDLALGE